MTKRTLKVGITRKYGTRYGASLRKIIKKFEEAQHSKYQCPLCCKNSVKRTCVGIWRCNGCKKVFAGGAYQLSTSIAQVAKTTMARIKKVIAEQGKATK